MTLRPIIAVPLLCGACYEVPGVDVGDVVTIAAQKQTLPASGTDETSLDITLDADAALSQAITITVSSGIVNFSATGDAMKTLTLKLPRGAGTGSDHRKGDSVPYRAGRTPGEVEITAAVGDITARNTLQLTAVAPTQMFSEANVTALKGDGTTKADISVYLLEPPPGAVSLSTLVASRACCLDTNGALTACTTRPPLRLTNVVELTSGNSVTVSATTEPYLGPDLLVAVVSSVVTDPSTMLACAADGKTSSYVTLTLKSQ